MGVRRALEMTSLIALAGVCAAAGLQLPATAAASAPVAASPSVADESQTGQAVLVPELSTETSTTYRLANGLYSLDAGLSVVNYQDDTGAWHQVDNTLVDAPGAAYAVRNGEAGHTVKIPADAGSTPVRISADGAWVSMQLRGLDGAPDVAGDTAFFSDVATADEVTYRATGEGVKESIILSAPPSGSGPVTYSYDLAAAAGLSAQLTEVGEVEFVDTVGAREFVVPTGNMVDSADVPAYTEDVKYALTSQPGGWRMTMTADAEWLRDPARVYPVVIDPALKFESGPQRDCVLLQESPNATRCTNTELQSGRDGFGTKHRSVLKFDLTGLPDGAGIQHANLELYFTRAKYTGTNAPYSVYRTDRGFSNGATWNSSGNSGSWSGGSPTGVEAPGDYNLGGSAAPGWRYWTVSDIVRGWHRDTFPNDGLVLKQAGSENVDNYVFFASTNNTLGSGGSHAPGKNPNLNVLYYNPPVVDARSSTCVDAGDSDATLHADVTNRNDQAGTVEVSLPGSTTQSVSLAAHETKQITFDGAYAPGAYTGSATYPSGFSGASSTYTVTVNACGTRTPGPSAADAGDRPFWTFRETNLTDRITSKVNVGTGNLLVQAQDVTVAGVGGWDLALARYYNSANAVGTGAGAGNMGPGWTTGFGDSVRLGFPSGDASKVHFFGPSAYRATFNRQGTSNDYDRERPGIKADLKRESDGTFTVTWYDKGKYTFDATGRLQTTRDHNGNQLAFNYVNDRLSTVSDTRGRTALFGYNGQNLVERVEIRKPDSTVMMRWAYGYSGGLLTSSKLDYVDNAAVGGTYASPGSDPTIGATTTYTYNAQNYLASITDARKNATGTGGVTQFTYDSQMRLAAQTRVASSGPNSSTGFAYYNGANNSACKRDNGNLETDAHNHTRVDGERVSSDVKDVTKYCNDNLGRVLRTTDARGNKRTTSWDDQSNVEQADMSGTGNGAEQYEFGYDGKDNPNQSTTPEGAVAKASYLDSDNDHSPTQVSNDHSSGGNGPQPSWNYAYDDKNNLIRAFSAADPDVEYRYCWTGVGQIDRIDPVTQTGTKSSSTEPTRDTSVADRCRADAAQGNDTIFDYNSDHELTEVDRPTGGDVSMTYDKLSRLATVTDARGVMTTYSYDGLDRIVRAVYTKSGETTQTVNWTYDLAGNLTYLGDANGNNTFGYDALNRKTSESDGTLTGPIASTDYAYDPAGNLTVMTENLRVGGTHRTAYGYNAVNMATSVDYTATNAVGATTMATRQITMGYDKRDRLTQTVWKGRGGQPDVLQEARYDKDGDVTCMYSFKSSNTPGNGAQECPSASGAQGEKLITFYRYDYTTGGVRTELKWGITELGGRYTRFDYDPIQRLEWARTRPSYTAGDGTDLRRFDFTYDRHSNLVKEKVSANNPTPGLRLGTQWAAFDPGDQICATARGESDPGVTCSSNLNGQTSFTHDAAGNLTTATGGTSQDLAGLNLAYNLPGQTTSITPPGGGPALGQAYDGVEQDRRTSSGSTAMAYGYAGLTNQATPIGTSSPAHTEWFVRDPAGKVLSMVDATNPAAPAVAGYYLLDDQDSVMAVINPAATSATRYLYEPYGETIRTWTDNAPGTSNSQYTESTTASPPAVDYNPWRYVSGYHDKTTGFLKFGTRYYMPAHATWTQPDPKNGRATNPLTLNRYNYSGCNPSNVTDASGRFWDTVGCIAAGFGIGALWAYDVVSLVAFLGLGVASGGSLAPVLAGRFALQVLATLLLQTLLLDVMEDLC